MKRIFPYLESILVLSLWAGCTDTIPVQAQSSGYSLRFRVHETGDIDRVKTKIDAPAVPWNTRVQTSTSLDSASKQPPGD